MGGRKQGHTSWKAGKGCSEQLLMGSWPDKALDKSGPGAGVCKCRARRRHALGVFEEQKGGLTVESFTSLHTAPQCPEAGLLRQGARSPRPSLGTNVTPD